MTTVRDALQAHYDEFGSLVPADLVAQAADPAHPLHGSFEWDDTKAGAAYRVAQAAGMIRSIRVTYVDDPEPRSVRAFLPVKREDAPTSYEPVRRVMADRSTRAAQLDAMRRDWLAFRTKWQHMQEFSRMVLDDLGEPAA